MRNNFFKMALMLGLISAIGPFAIDMYLPALPMIGQHLNADITDVQLSVTVFFLAMGFGQLIYGPLSDAWGRIAPMQLGLGIFLIASVGCAMAGSIHTLLLFRFLQGLGAAACSVVPRAVVRDLHTGHEAARLMSLLMLVFSVSPILAPLTGSLLIEWIGWRAVFWFITISALAGMLLVTLYLPETWGKERRQHKKGLGISLRAYGLLLRDWRFLGLVFTSGFAMSVFFVYLAGSPFVMMEHFGLSPRMYSLAFALNAAAFFSCAQLNGPLARRFGLPNVVRVAALGGGVTLAVSLSYHLLGGNSLVALIVLYFISSCFYALVVPTTAVLIMDSHGPIAGSASALMGMMQMFIGAAAMGFAAHISDGTPLRLVMGSAVCSFLALALCFITLGVRQEKRPSVTV